MWRDASHDNDLEMAVADSIERESSAFALMTAIFVTSAIIVLASWWLLIRA